MKFCKNCGNELKENAQFCNACGTPVEGHKNVEASQSRSVPAKKPMSPKTKRWIIAGVVAAVLLFGAYKIGESFFSKERLINNFEEALIAQDEKAVAELLHSEDKQFDINKDSIKAFMKYYKVNPDEIKIAIESLRNQSKIMDVQPNGENYNDFSTSGEMVNLNQKGKFIFYDKYQLMIGSVYLMLETNYRDTELYVDKEKVDKTDQADFEKKYGPYVPGIHDVEAKLKTDYVDLVVEESVSVKGGDKPTSVDLYLDGQNVHIDTSIDSEEVDLKGKLYINDKDVGINPFENNEFGPVLTDGTMKVAVEAELPWGTIKTKEKEIDSNYVEINLGEHDETQKIIMDTVVQNTRESLAAVASGSTSKMTAATDDFKQSIQEDIDELKDYEELFKSKYLSSVFDLDSFKLSYWNNVWIVNVNVLIKSQSDYYYKDEAPELKDQNDAYEVTLIYNEKAKKWFVHTMNFTYFNDENVKEIKEESPKEYTTKGSATAAKQTSDTDKAANIQVFMGNYLNGLITAINTNNFNAVSDYMKTDSELYKSQKSLVSNLYSKGTTEELIDFKVTGTSEEGQSFSISTYEKIKINYSSGKSETKEYEWTYKGVIDGTVYLLTSIEDK